MRETELRRLVKAVREFFKSFESLNFRDLSPMHVQKLVDAHNLSVDALLTKYEKPVKDMKTELTKTKKSS